MRLIFFSLVPRNDGQNNMFGIDIDIELGNTEEEVKDDPGKNEPIVSLWKFDCSSSKSWWFESIGNTYSILVKCVSLMHCQMHKCWWIFREGFES